MGTNDGFFIGEEAHRVKLDDDGTAWVDIKKEMSIADWDRFERDSVRITPDSSGEEKGLGGTFHRSEVTLLEINIMAWSFDKPVNHSTISKLRRHIADLIIAEVDKLNVSPKERAAVKFA